MHNIINNNYSFILEKELKNNKLFLKKGHILGKSKRRSYLVDTFDDYIYVYNENNAFKNLDFIPIESKNLKSKNFGKLKVLSNLIKYKNTLKQIPRC